jgi:hypothetical protein
VSAPELSTPPQVSGRKRQIPQRLRKAAVFEQLGPGLITGAADDDPSGIATYSQAGAQFGFNMLWTMVLTYPLMTAVQLVSAQIGRVTGCGLAKNIGDVFPRNWGRIPPLFFAPCILNQQGLPVHSCVSGTKQCAKKRVVVGCQAPSPSLAC